jgi:hypothetical protein
MNDLELAVAVAQAEPSDMVVYRRGKDPYPGFDPLDRHCFAHFMVQVVSGAPLNGDPVQHVLWRVHKCDWRVTSICRNAAYACTLCHEKIIQQKDPLWEVTASWQSRLKG